MHTTLAAVMFYGIPWHWGKELVILRHIEVSWPNVAGRNFGSSMSLDKSGTFGTVIGPRLGAGRNQPALAIQLYLNHTSRW
jgi:hypothetical protein